MDKMCGPGARLGDVLESTTGERNDVSGVVPDVRARAASWGAVIAILIGDKKFIGVVQVVVKAHPVNVAVVDSWSGLKIIVAAKGGRVRNVGRRPDLFQCCRTGI